jgi:glycine oxidase
MLAPIAEATPGEEPLLCLGLAAARSYPAFVSELAAASGLDPGYSACGTLVVARDSDEAEALERELELRRALELSVERLRASSARRCEPALAPTLRLGLSVPDDHAIDPRALTSALERAAVHAGAELRSGADVVELWVSGEAVDGVRLGSGEQISAEQVVVAAGPWSQAIAGLPAADGAALRPVKGQVMRLHDPAGPGLLTRIIRMAGAYIVPRGDGRYVLGATMEERGFDTTVTAGAMFELLRDATELVPGVGELVIDELSAGLRPGTADNAPVIGPGALAGLHWATGHHRNGILLAPVTAEIVLAGVLGEQGPDGAEALAPGRFAIVRAGDHS